MKTVRIAIIGGTGLESLLPEGTRTRLGTPYGPTPPLTFSRIGKREVALLPRHGERHTQAPHRINYRANIWALHALGVERVLATSAVGGINSEYSPGDLVIPDDLIDFTKHRVLTFYDEAPVTHIDMTEAYCPELREALTEASRESGAVVWERGIYACTEGPRFETPAEVRMLRALGCDVVGMTGSPEVVLARELEMCYATLCYVSNRAAGMQRRLTAEEVAEVGGRMLPLLRRVLARAVEGTSEKRGCGCPDALAGARV